MSNPSSRLYTSLYMRPIFGKMVTDVEALEPKPMTLEALEAQTSIDGASKSVYDVGFFKGIQLKAESASSLQKDELGHWILVHTETRVLEHGALVQGVQIGVPSLAVGVDLLVQAANSMAIERREVSLLPRSSALEYSVPSSLGSAIAAFEATGNKLPTKLDTSEKFAL